MELINRVFGFTQETLVHTVTVHTVTEEDTRENKLGLVVQLKFEKDF